MFDVYVWIYEVQSNVSFRHASVDAISSEFFPACICMVDPHGGMHASELLGCKEYGYFRTE